MTEDGHKKSPVGPNIGPYQVISLLSRGGMGEVHRALDPRPGREAPIELLPAAISTDKDRLRTSFSSIWPENIRVEDF